MLIKNSLLPVPTVFARYFCAVRLSALLVALPFFTGCSYLGGGSLEDIVTFSSADMGVQASSRVAHPKARHIPKGGGRRQVGKPYTINGKTYYPKHEPNYNETGTASWYGSKFHGRLTANGEIFNMHSVSAAHTTMPLPSYAEVTNLENGRTIIVRVNDRGPFMHNRVIDLSKRSSELLDFNHKGVAKVRVKYLGPADLAGSDDEKLEASLKINGRPATAPSSTLAAVSNGKPKGRALETSRLLKAATPRSAPKGFSLGKAYKAYSRRSDVIVTNGIDDDHSGQQNNIEADLSRFKPYEKNLLKLAGLIKSPAETPDKVALSALPPTSVKTIPLPAEAKASEKPVSRPVKVASPVALASLPKPRATHEIDLSAKLESKPQPKKATPDEAKSAKVTLDEATPDEIAPNEALPITATQASLAPNAVPEHKSASPAPVYHIQVARFHSIDNAKRTIPAVPKAYAPVIETLEQDGTLTHLVLTRSFSSHDKAKEALQAMSERGFLSARIINNNRR